MTNFVCGFCSRWFGSIEEKKQHMKQAHSSTEELDTNISD